MPPKFWDTEWFKRYERVTKVCGAILFPLDLAIKFWKLFTRGGPSVPSTEIWSTIVVSAYFTIAVIGLLLFSLVVGDWVWKEFVPERPRFRTAMAIGLPIFAMLLTAILGTQRMFFLPPFFFGFFCLIGFGFVALQKSIAYFRK